MLGVPSPRIRDCGKEETERIPFQCDEDENEEEDEVAEEDGGDGVAPVVRREAGHDALVRVD